MVYGVAMLLLLIPLTFFVTASSLLGLGVWSIRRRRASARWPRVPGRILEARVESGQSRSRDDNGFDQTHTVFRPVIRYEYQVQGVAHQSEQLDPGGVVWTGQAAAEAVVGRYPAGKVVEVLQDPANPANSFLESPALGVGAVIIIAMGAVFGVIAVITLIAATRG